MFLVVGHQVCTHLRRDFVPLLFADPLQVIKVSKFHAGIPIHDPFSMPWPWWYMAPSIVPLMRCSCPVPLSRKTLPKHNVSTSMFDGGDGVLGVIDNPPPPNTASWVDAKELDFGHIWPHHFHPVLLWIIVKCQTGLYKCFLEQEDLAGTAGFQSFKA